MRLAIGDVHGRPFWKNYLDKDFSDFFFTGDYFDSFDIPFSKQYKNFTEICKAARKDSRLKLCIGNHDYHYLAGVDNQRYSGFQDNNYQKISDVLEENIDLITVVHETKDKYLLSHAGVTNYFLKSLHIKKPLEINSSFEKDRNILNFNGIDNFGDNVTQSPIWIRPRSLFQDALSGYNQIVGHTPMREISELKTFDNKNTITFIDTHDTESIYQF